jgi:hypothetical protein
VKQRNLRSLQLLGSLALALTIVGIDYALLGLSPTAAPDSFFSNTIRYVAFVLLIPGGIIAWFIAGGAHDINLKLALEINLAIYTGLAYFLFRFLEWRKDRDRSR